MSATPGAPDAASPDYCPWCGRAAAGDGHEKCLRRLEWLDPPRYCAQCARRMVVQVSPSGWTARCSRHGELDAERWRAGRAALGG